MPVKGNFKENKLIADHGTWQEWDIGTPKYPNVVMKIGTIDMNKLRKRYGGRIVAAPHHGNVYAHFWDGNKIKRVHRVILNAAPGTIVDHRNHDGVDNRRCNIRFATQHENRANTKVSKVNASGITGVAWVKRERKWRARLQKNQKDIHLGYFSKMVDAVTARKEAEIKYFGEFAYAKSINNKGTIQCW